jgi:hypothetical protein
MTTWRPDTCGCEIEYSDPDMKIIRVHQRCAKHDGAHDDAAHFETVLAHNRKKNIVHNAIGEHLKSIGSVITPDMFATHYDDNDDLHIVGAKLGSDDQSTIKLKIESALGKSALTFKD